MRLVKKQSNGKVIDMSKNNYMQDVTDMTEDEIRKLRNSIRSMKYYDENTEYVNERNKKYSKNKNKGYSSPGRPRKY
jgi:wobble nucleotide-excising tRNase